MRINKKTCIWSVLIGVTLGFLLTWALNYDKVLVSLDTSKCFAIYGIDESVEDTLILMKPVKKLTSEEVASLTDTQKNLDGDTLLMVNQTMSEEAKEEWLETTNGLEVYGTGVEILMEKGFGIFRKQYKVTKDIMYLSPNTAKVLGLMEGTPNYQQIGEEATPAEALTNGTYESAEGSSN